jgi:hypothetical protein
MNLGTKIAETNQVEIEINGWRSKATGTVPVNFSSTTECA